MSMKLNLSIFIFYLVGIVYVTNAQTSYYNTFPICNTTKETKQFVKQFDSIIPPSDKFIYLFHLSINSCPRCEGLVTQLYDLLPQKAAKAIVFHGLSQKDLDQYLDNNPSFKDKQIFLDKASALMNLIDHSQTMLAVAYLYKFEVATGECKVVMPLLGQKISESLANDIVNSNETLKCTTQLSEQVCNINQGWDRADELKIGEDGFGNITDLKVIHNKLWFLNLNDGNYYTFDANLKYAGKIQTSAKHLTHFAKNEYEKKLIIDYSKLGIAKLIYLTIIEGNNPHSYSISSSFPKMSLVIENGKDSNIYYDNMPTFIKVDSSLNIEQASIAPIQYNNSFSPYLSMSHLSIKKFNNYFVMPLEKGFPTVGTDDEILKDSLQNPFLENFYDTLNHTIELTSQDSSIGFYGKIPDLYRKLKLGYSYYNPIFATRKEYLFVADAIAGEVTIYHKSMNKNGLTPKARLELFPFKVTDVKIKNKDSFPVPLDYILSYKEELRKTKIISLFSEDNLLHVLIKMDDAMILKTYNLNWQLISEQTLSIPYCDSYENLQLVKLGDNHLRLIACYKKGENYMVLNKKVR